jgi:hypothetical protein
MATPSPSNASDYRPPGHQHSLFQRYCESCHISELCGETHAATACGDPSEYSSDVHHPVSSRFTAVDLALPKAVPTWGDLDLGSRSSIVVASEPNPPLDRYAVDLRTALRMRSPGQQGKPIAFLLGRDADLEQVWGRRGRLGRDLSRKGYQLAVAPGFSTWFEDPPYAGIVAVARTASSAFSIARQLPTIPTVVWRTDFDIHRQITWLGSTTPPRWISIDLGVRDRSEFNWLVEGVKRIAGEFQARGPCPSLIAYGPGTLYRIRLVQDAWPESVVIASQMPYLVSTSGHRLTEELVRLEAPEYTHSELIQLNAATFEHAVSPDAMQAEPSAWSVTSA